LFLASFFCSTSINHQQRRRGKNYVSVAKLFFKRCTIGSAKSGRETCCLLTRGICFYSNNIMIFLLPLSNACNKQSSFKHTYCLPCRIALHTVRILLLGSCIGQPIGFYYLFSNPCLQYVTLCFFFKLLQKMLSHAMMII
jgi:hypothetical protein